ncbi:MAG: hypothetical protein KAR23_04670 [Candidatus Aenigmarchaeota archaeon]|nr:hypothetical protein [Candidatus Aenigmarchaeota archaeon]
MDILYSNNIICNLKVTVYRFNLPKDYFAFSKDIVILPLKERRSTEYDFYAIINADDTLKIIDRRTFTQKRISKKLNLKEKTDQDIDLRYLQEHYEEISTLIGSKIEKTMSLNNSLYT